MAGEKDTGDMKPIRYEIVDTQTGNIVGGGVNGKRTSTRAEKLNQDYGATRYTRKAIWE